MTDDIAGRLEQYGCGITYKPTAVEVVPAEIFPGIFSKMLYVIQPTAGLVPAEEYQKAQEIIGDISAFILIPGREFDATGTRHGKGAGWYDRFLSLVPKNWLRIGFCYSDQFSEETLVRESWDEPMDFVCVVDRETREVASYETHARDGVA